MIAAADEKFGRIDALVNVAAITDRGTILDTDEALFDRMFAINTRAPFFLIQDAVKLMLRDGIEAPSSTSPRCPQWPASPSSPPIAPPRAHSTP